MTTSIDKMKRAMLDNGMAKVRHYFSADDSEIWMYESVDPDISHRIAVQVEPAQGTARVFCGIDRRMSAQPTLEAIEAALARDLHGAPA